MVAEVRLRGGLETPRGPALGRTARLLLAWAFLGVACSDDGTGPGNGEGTWVQVDVGRAHACALTDTGQVYCWGSNSLGQAGVPADPVLQPTLVETEHRFRALGAGGDNTCARTQGGRLFCWGSNALGQLGNGGILDAVRPVAVDGQGWGDFSVGTYHLCALDSAGEVHCWGGDRWDVVLGSRAPTTCDAPLGELRWPCAGVPRPTGMGTGFEWVEVGLYQTCAGSEANGPVCWGTNDAGQLGAATADTCVNNDPLHPLERPCSRSPVAPAGVSLSSVRPGTTHACGSTDGGSSYCWGGLILNYGQVGDGSLAGAAEPVPLSGLASLTSVVPSHESHVRTFSCGIDSSGQGFCWGSNRWGQLGSSADACPEGGTGPCSAEPVAMAGARPLAQLALGVEFGCALTQDDAIVCWGFNESGQLGDGTTTSRATPAEVLSR